MYLPGKVPSRLTRKCEVVHPAVLKDWQNHGYGCGLE